MSMSSHIKNLRSCLTMISKHSKAIKSSRGFASRASYAFSCFDIMVKHFRAFLIHNLKLDKEAMKNLITEEAIKELINGLEDKLVKKIYEQVKEIENLRNRLEGRVAILEHLVKVQENAL